MEEKLGTKELATKVLREIGCTPQEMEDGRIRFDYQGITFLMEADDEDKFVNLIWPWCYSISKFDIDDFARLRQAVNEMNARGKGDYQQLLCYSKVIGFGSRKTKDS